MMRKIWDYLKREPLVLPMIVVLIAMMIAARFYDQTEQAGGAGSETSAFSEEKRLETTKKITGMTDAQKETISKDPRMIALGTVVLIFLGAGIVLDWKFLFRLRRRWPDTWRWGVERNVGWNLGDVFKIFVMLFFIEASIVFIVHFLDQMLPGYEPNMNVTLMMATFLRSLFILAYIVESTRRRYGTRWSDLGCVFRDGVGQARVGLLSYLGLVPVYGILIFALSMVLKALNYEPPVQTPVQVLYTEQNAHYLLLFSVFIGVLGPFFEEVVFRGFLYQAVRKHAGVTVSIVLTSVIFASLHAHWVAFFPIFLLGIALNVLFEKTGSIIPGAVLHGVHNVLMLSITFLLKGLIT